MLLDHLGVHIYFILFGYDDDLVDKRRRLKLKQSTRNNREAAHIHKLLGGAVLTVHSGSASAHRYYRAGKGLEAGKGNVVEGVDDGGCNLFDKLTHTELPGVKIDCSKHTQSLYHKFPSKIYTFANIFPKNLFQHKKI